LQSGDVGALDECQVDEHLRTTASRTGSWTGSSLRGWLVETGQSSTLN
jgi:hypothetical protein